MIRNQTCIFLVSKTKGIGKTTMGLFLCYYFNKKHTKDHGDLAVQTDSFEWLTGKSQFNSTERNKVLIGFEEFPYLSQSEFITLTNKLKNRITNPYIAINPKGVDQLTCMNHADYIATSNNPGCVPMETDDNRRYFVPDVVHFKDSKTTQLVELINLVLKRKGLTNEEIAYNIKNNKEISDGELKEVFKCFYSYCKENHDPTFNPEKELPITEAIKDNNDKQMDFLFKY